MNLLKICCLDIDLREKNIEYHTVAELATLESVYGLTEFVLGLVLEKKVEIISHFLEWGTEKSTIGTSCRSYRLLGPGKKTTVFI